MVPKNEYAPYFEQYLQLVDQEKYIVENLIESQKEFDATLRDLDSSKHNFAYEEGKWTLKELVQHTIDTERVFTYRALCFARNDKTDLPGFDQDIFTHNDNSNERKFEDLLNEMKVVRVSSIALFKSFPDEVLKRIGVASNNKMSVRALGYLFSGHQLHHLNIVKERYL
jgi:hypothetical protein